MLTSMLTACLQHAKNLVDFVEKACVQHDYANIFASLVWWHASIITPALFHIYGKEKVNGRVSGRHQLTVGLPHSKMADVLQSADIKSDISNSILEIVFGTQFREASADI